MPYAGLKFYTYQSLKGMWYSHHAKLNQDALAAKPPLYWSLLFGGIAGLVGQTVTYPLDVVRRRMQVQGADTHHVAARTTTWGSFKSIVNTHGLRGLFQGLTINYLKVVPQTAIGFTVYDAAKSVLGLSNHL